MSSTDWPDNAALLGAPVPARAASRRRDRRVDVIRGVALLMIFIDHTSGNMFSKITLLGLQHTDAAYFFVLLSGFSCMAAYGKSVSGKNLGSNLRRILLRCLKLYVTQMTLLGGACLLVASVRYLSAIEFVPERLPLGISDSSLFNYSAGSIWPVTLMLQAPAYFDLLRLYIVMLLVFPLIAWGIKRAPRATILISVVLWISTHHPIGLHVDDYPLRHPWTFNPFAWQLLFVLGAGLKHYMDKIGPLPKHRVLSAICGWIVVAAFIYTFGQNIPALKAALPHLPRWRENLQPLHLLNTLALLYLAFTTTAPSRLAETPLVRIIETCGRHSLTIYSVGTMLSLAVDLCFMAYGTGAAVQVPATLAGCLCLAALAAKLEARKGRTTFPGRRWTMAAVMLPQGGSSNTAR